MIAEFLERVPFDEVAVHFSDILHVLRGEGRVVTIRIIKLLEKGLCTYVIRIAAHGILQQRTRVVVTTSLGALAGKFDQIEAVLMRVSVTTTVALPRKGWLGRCASSSRIPEITESILYSAFSPR